MFNKDFYVKNRAALKKLMNKGIAVFVANDEASMNYPDNTYHYRQDSNFAYFFGLNHPDLANNLCQIYIPLYLRFCCCFYVKIRHTIRSRIYHHHPCFFWMNTIHINLF